LHGKSPYLIFKVSLAKPVKLSPRPLFVKVREPDYRYTKLPTLDKEGLGALEKVGSPMICNTP